MVFIIYQTNDYHRMISRLFNNKCLVYIRTALRRIVSDGTFGSLELSINYFQARTSKYHHAPPALSTPLFDNKCFNSQIVNSRGMPQCVDFCQNSNIELVQISFCFFISTFFAICSGQTNFLKHVQHEGAFRRFRRWKNIIIQKIFEIDSYDQNKIPQNYFFHKQFTTFYLIVCQILD